MPGVVTGKPIDRRLARTARVDRRGVVTCMVEAARHLGLALDGARVIVQGYGQVGGTAARLAASLRTKVVAVSDVQGGIHDPKGLDLSKVDAWLREQHSLAGYPGVDHVSNREILELPCDVLIPAAIQNQITVDNAPKLACRLLVEGANGPTTLEADDILRDRGVFTVPDVVANAGGVTVSYFEWVQDGQQFFWTEEEVNNKLISIMQRAFRDVLHMAVERNLDMRTAALIRASPASPARKTARRLSVSVRLPRVGQAGLQHLGERHLHLPSTRDTAACCCCDSTSSPASGVLRASRRAEHRHDAHQKKRIRRECAVGEREGVADGIRRTSEKRLQLIEPQRQLPQALADEFLVPRLRIHLPEERRQRRDEIEVEKTRHEAHARALERCRGTQRRRGMRVLEVLADDFTLGKDHAFDVQRGHLADRIDAAPFVRAEPARRLRQRDVEPLRVDLDPAARGEG